MVERVRGGEEGDVKGYVGDFGGWGGKRREELYGGELEGCGEDDGVVD